MIFRPDQGNEPIRRPIVIMQLDVRKGQNIEIFLDNIKERIEKRTPIVERTVQTPPANIPIEFKSKTWEWTSTSPYLNYKKYHPNDEKMSTTQYLVAIYYRMGPTGVAEVFLVSNSGVPLKRFVRNANADFSVKITKR